MSGAKAAREHARKRRSLQAVVIRFTPGGRRNRLRAAALDFDAAGHTMHFDAAAAVPHVGPQ